jgi:2-keto-4-pentenoate hydratase/2-oxohepta-3-ene-1,7-dioic acid hydratase in catechol pathway
MRIVRYQETNAIPRYGWMFEDKIGNIEGTPFEEFRRGEAKIINTDVKLCAPVSPSKIICAGRNYAAHAKEHNAEIPEVPLIFLKPASSLIGPEETIILPPQSQQVEHEAELGVVISKKGRWISIDEAMDYVFGYTLANDITARDLQKRDGQWTRGKGFDTFCPVGPWIETDFDPTDALITCHVNDELRQMASTRDMIFNIQQLISFVSSVMTWEPGDLLLTGTPSGVGPLQAGDQVDVTIEGLGNLTNYVSAAPRLASGDN